MLPSPMKETAVEAPPNPGSQLRINKADLEQRGYDDQCPQSKNF